MEQDKKHLYTELTALVAAANAALKQAEAFADLHKLSFHFGPAYAMGGQYIGDPVEFEDYKAYNYNVNTDALTGWAPSSGSC